MSTPELAEVFAINTLAPFILNSKLKPLMASTNPEGLKFIVNVSAMEGALRVCGAVLANALRLTPHAAGKFYRHKSPNHPHTNMAKAALNMMTRTSAADYAESNIYMTAVRETLSLPCFGSACALHLRFVPSQVDTGWINDGKSAYFAPWR